MKNINKIKQHLKKLIFSVIFITTIAVGFGQNPPPPPGGSSGTNDPGTSVGGGNAPSGSGLILMSVFVLGYGLKRYYDYKKLQKVKVKID